MGQAIPRPPNQPAPGNAQQVPPVGPPRRPNEWPWIFGILLVGCVVAGIATAHSGSGPTVGSSSTGYAATPPGTTSGPAPITGATLGGDRYAFDILYGMPTSNDSDTTGTWDFALSDGSPAEISVDASPGADGTVHVRTIFFGPMPTSGVTWDAATAANVARTLLPPDAHHVGDMSTSAGTDHIYRSVRLAATFPATDFFTDVGSHAVTVGTFDYFCHEDGAGGLTLCVMGLGQHQLASPVTPPLSKPTPVPSHTPVPTPKPSPTPTPTATPGPGGK